MSRISALLLALALLLPPSLLSAAEGPRPQGWEIDLQPAFELFAEQLAGAYQQEINFLTTQQVAIRDTQLALVYLELLARLSAREQDKLKLEQAEWCTMRARRAAKAADAEEGSSKAPMSHNLVTIKLTEERTAALRKRLMASMAVTASQRTVSPFPEGWRPDLHGAFDWLERDSKDGPITAIARNRHLQAGIRDAELALTYLELWVQVDEKERRSLKIEQTAWLATRAKKMKTAAKEQSDETLAALRSYHTSLELSQQRTAELRRRLADAVHLRPSR